MSSLVRELPPFRLADAVLTRTPRVEIAEVRSEHVVSCRLYRTRDGFARLPSDAWLRDALRRSAAPEERLAGDTVGFGQVLGARA